MYFEINKGTKGYYILIYNCWRCSRRATSRALKKTGHTSTTHGRIWSIKAYIHPAAYTYTAQAIRSDESARPPPSKPSGANSTLPSSSSVTPTSQTLARPGPTSAPSCRRHVEAPEARGFQHPAAHLLQLRALAARAAALPSDG